MDTQKVKHLVFAILEFFDQQLQSPVLNPDAKESLEVVTQCLESAYGISLHNGDARALYPLPAPLPEIFAAGLEQLSSPSPASTADREAAEQLKSKGNELLKQDQYQEAIDCYTKAIALDGRNAVYYSNRAAAFSKTGDHQQCLADCQRALDIDPKYSKAYGRKGLAHTALGQHKEARECFWKALELDPVNDGYRDNLRLSEQSLRDHGSSATGGTGGPGPGGLDFSSLLNNPALMNMATSMLSNPQMQSVMANMMSGVNSQSPGGAPSMANFLQVGQQLAEQMQASNPDLVDQLRSQMRNQNPPSGDDATKKNP